MRLAIAIGQGKKGLLDGKGQGSFAATFVCESLLPGSLTYGC